MDDGPAHIAVFHISSELLAEVLKLPTGSRIVGFRQDPNDLWLNSHLGRYEIKVESDSLPPTEAGKRYPTARPQYGTDDSGSCVFLGWGL